MRKTALVTGATGFLGSHITEELRAAGYEVIEVARAALIATTFTTIVKERQPALLVHAAGSASVEDSLSRPLADFQSSVQLTAEILEAVRTHSPQTHFVLLSSASVYGAPATLPISEECPAAPISPYGYHKLMAELLVDEAEKIFGLKTTIFRIFSSYGERIRRQVIHDLCCKLITTANAPLNLHGTGRETRDFIHARDVARAVVHVHEHAVTGLFNLASGNETSIGELAAHVQRHLGTSIPVGFDGVVRTGVPRFWRASVAKLSATGFSASVPLDRGLRQYCDWFKAYRADPRQKETAIVTVPSPRGISEPSADVGLIGFASMGTWMGGIAYLDLLTQSVAQLPVSERPRMALVFTEAEGVELYTRILERMSEVIFVGPRVKDFTLSLPYSPTVRKVGSMEEAIALLDVFFPVNSNVLPSKKAVSWIPDFQHLYLPHLFSREAREDRDRRYALIAQQAAHVVFSSRDAAKDFERYNTSKTAQVHVLPFYAMPDAECFATDATAIVAKYSLPQKFLICCNQFWEHKNHLTLFSTIKILREHGVHVPLVCTGALSESRNPAYIEQIKAKIKEFGISDLVHILGELPRSDQLQLMRASIAVVQPSLFEGWSTVVEDARAFGKTIFLSDLNVHREQAPRWAIYFDPNNALDLAEKIVQEAGSLPAGPQEERERMARADAERLTASFGQNFMKISRAVMGIPESPRIKSTAKPDLSIVLATKNRAALLTKMVGSIPDATKGLNVELIVVDGSSNDGSDRIIQGFSGSRVFNEEKELGPGRHSWPQLYNFGFSVASGTWSIFASDDIAFEPACFTNALIALSKAPREVAGGIFFYKNEVAEEGWDQFGIDFLARHLPLLNYGVIRTDVFNEVSGLNEAYQFYAADGDLTYKIADAGYVLSPLPGSMVVHHNWLDAQKQVNLNAVQHDMGLLKSCWSKYGEGEKVLPRRMLWNPRLAELYALPLRETLSGEFLNRLWRVISCLQHGMHAAAEQEYQRMGDLGAPERVLAQVHMFFQQLAVAGPSNTVGNSVGQSEGGTR